MQRLVIARDKSIRLASTQHMRKLLPDTRNNIQIRTARFSFSFGRAFGLCIRTARRRAVGSRWRFRRSRIIAFTTSTYQKARCCQKKRQRKSKRGFHFHFPDIEFTDNLIVSTKVRAQRLATCIFWYSRSALPFAFETQVFNLIKPEVKHPH